MVKAVFLDRDGTITLDTGHVHKIEDLDFLPNSISALKMLQNTGLKLFVVTNQSGIGRGFFAEEDYHEVTHYMLSEMKKWGIEIHEVFHCPHHPNDDCDCRKPKTKMLELAAEKHNINLKKSYVIGDKTIDVMLGKNSGSKTILVLTGYAGKESQPYEVTPDFVADDLLHAAEWIVEQEKN